MSGKAHLKLSARTLARSRRNSSASVETFTQVGILEFDDELLKAIKAWTDKSPYGHTVPWVVEQVDCGNMQVWKGKNVQGVYTMITHVVVYPDGEKLHIWGIGGKGYILSQDYAWRRLLEYCEERNYKWISGVSEYKSFERLVNRLRNRFGTIRHSVEWVKELTDVCS